ncbi:MAG TPA: TonB-dependent receptor [Caulobacteraceae bacterium]|jgi:outer membrane receptor protein involved in Fe transport
MHRNIARLALSTTSARALSAGALAIGFVLIGASTAAAADDAAAPAASANTVQEVIVTAEKRPEPLQRVPVAVQVVTGVQLQDNNVNALSDLAQTVPDLHIVNTGSYSNSLNIRGIGSGAGNPAFDQSVAMFVDDIYYGRAHMTQGTFLDMDRIEVLKGPQSTFFGNNAIAGALNMVTAKPGWNSDGYARVLYGSYGTYAVEAADNIPINDQFAVRIAGIANGDSGWIRNVDTGGLAPIEHNEQGRITFAWKPSQDFDATLKLEAGEDKISGSASDTPFQWINCPPPAPLATKGINNFCPFAIARHVPMGFGNNNNSGLSDQYADLKTDDVVLNMNWHLAGGLTLTSVTGYAGYDFTSHEDNASAGTPVLSTNSFMPDKYDQFSEEVRLTSPTDQPIEYMIGAYYQYDKIHELINGNAAYVESSFPTYAALGLISHADLLALQAAQTFGYDVGYDQKENVESVFGSLGWNITDKLKLNIGLRGTSDQKSFVGTIAYGAEAGTYGGLIPFAAGLQHDLAFILGPPGAYPYSRTDKALMGNVGVQYQIDPQAMLYATVSRGFKAGGFNAISPSPIGGLIEPTYSPEYVDSYEVGVKSKWFDNRVLINFDLFRENYADLQVNALVQLPVNSTIAVTNAASSVSQGAELQTQWVLGDHFDLKANITYLDAHYDSYLNASPTYLEKQNHVTHQNLSGRPLDFAPKWSGSVTAEYHTELPGEYRLSAELTPFYQSSYYNSAGTDDPNFVIPGKTRLDGRITLDSPGRRWAVDLIGNNITNAVIPVSYGTNNTLGGKEEPVNVSLQLRFKW